MRAGRPLRGEGTRGCGRSAAPKPGVRPRAPQRRRLLCGSGSARGGAHRASRSAACEMRKVPPRRVLRALPGRRRGVGRVFELQRQAAALQLGALQGGGTAVSAVRPSRSTGSGSPRPGAHQHGSVRRFRRCLLVEVDEGAALLREQPDGLDLPEPAWWGSSASRPRPPPAAGKGKRSRRRPGCTAMEGGSLPGSAGNRNPAQGRSETGRRGGGAAPSGPTGTGRTGAAGHSPAEAALQRFLGDLESDVSDPQRIAVPAKRHCHQQPNPCPAPADPRGRPPSSPLSCARIPALPGRVLGRQCVPGARRGRVPHVAF